MFVGNCVARKILGFILVLIGVILILCFMPFWMWLAVLGLVLIALGIIIVLRGYN